MKRILSTVLALTLVFILSISAKAESSLPEIVVGDNAIPADAIQTSNGVLYVSVEQFFEAGSSAFALSQDGKTMKVASSVKPGTAVAIVAKRNKNYVNVNGRFIYIRTGVKFKGKSCYLPLSVLLCATGAVKVEDEEAGPQTYELGKKSMLSGSEFYKEELVFWMAKTINSEAGNQPLEGKIAVGNVIINRMRSPRYANTVTGVIFQKGQFDGTLTEAFKAIPPEECVIAAKIAIEGTQIYHNAMYFNRAGMNSWAHKNRPFLGKLGGHDFYA